MDDARFVGVEIWWSERVPSEGGRTAVRRLAADGSVEFLLPSPWDARSRVHEYGGAAWTVTPIGQLVFVEKSDQRVWLLTVGGDPQPLTPDADGIRFGDLTVTDDQVFAVRETHAQDGSSAVRDLVAIPLDGSGGADSDRVRSVVKGGDFLAYPRVSPDGTRIAWVAWDNPDMPWDATELRVGNLGTSGPVTEWWTIAGGPRDSVVQPVWVGEDELTFSSDRTGRWNLYRRDASDRHGSTERALAPSDADTGGPLWNLGIRWFLPLEDGRIVAVRTHGTDAIVVIDPAGSERVIDSPTTSRVLLADAQGTRVLFTGSGSGTLGGLWLLDLAETDPRPTLYRSAVDSAPDAAWLPPAEAVTVDGPHGEVHAFMYAPANPGVAGPSGERPPYLVLAHGGPTTHVSGGASLDIAYFTSRGIGVLDVNYGGSTGYGRAYRERLVGQWGIVDRDDVVAAASGIADRGVADSTRLAIKGGSAGGWTVLCALTASDAFAAGISRYGVADLRALAADTHDFEARYLDGLVGPLPGTEDVYLERSPLSHLDRFTTPMLLEQGLDDHVVPPAQSEAVRDALAERAIAHAYLAFDGEGHGFRRRETLVRSLEAELSFLGQALGFETPGVPRLPLE